MVYRDRIGNTAVVVEMSVHIDRAAERRKRAGRHDGAVVVAHDVELGKIGCLSCEGIRCRQAKFSRIFRDGIVVNRVGTVCWSAFRRYIRAKDSRSEAGCGRKR